MNYGLKFLKKGIRYFLSFLDIQIESAPIKKQDKYKVKVLNLLKTDLVLDIGANIGQYASNLIKNGYNGNIISFEPIQDMYDKLLNNSKFNEKWNVYERCAIGDTNGEIEINVSQNYESSSILKVMDKSINVEPLTAYIRKEKVKIFRLSDILELQKFERIHLKIDVQGYEELVLNGADKIFDKVGSLSLEISLIPLYEGALTPEVLLLKIKDLGFEPVFYVSAFTDYKTGSILQLDGLFVKQNLMKLID